MSRTDEQLIGDILEASEDLALIVAAGRAKFYEDRITRRAAERLLEIIGEAAGNLSNETVSRLPQLRVREARRARDLLAHHYSKVDYDIVWDTIPTSVPQFASTLSSELGRS